jgi:predicted dithiol-disulfide oxidoreductase (DUF899 family)
MNTAVAEHAIVSPEEWITARKSLLDKEKQLRKQMDEVAKMRLNLPWERLEKNYVFEGSKGKQSLPELFDERSQLLIYHFMFGPDWKEGCPSCSLLADHIDGALVHLAARDVTFAVISRAPYAKIAEFQQRMGWQFQWVSSYGSDFNYDFHVSFSPQERTQGHVHYNYSETHDFGGDEGPGLSAFYKDTAGDVFHTCSTYARGGDILIGAYNYMDYAPLGRNEDGLSFTMEWVRHHDRYPHSAKTANSTGSGDAAV